VHQGRKVQDWRLGGRRAHLDAHGAGEQISNLLDEADCLVNLGSLPRILGGNAGQLSDVALNGGALAKHLAINLIGGTVRKMVRRVGA
jgi:hypothetical protein